MAPRSLTRAVSGVTAAVLAAPIAFAQGTAPSNIDVPKNSFRSAVVSILNYVLTFVGLIAVAMLIYGGFLYLTSAGNEEQTKKAKTTILYAIIGIVVIALSYVIVNTLIGEGRNVIQGQPIVTQ